MKFLEASRANPSIAGQGSLTDTHWVCGNLREGTCFFFSVSTCLRASCSTSKTTSGRPNHSFISLSVGWQLFPNVPSGRDIGSVAYRAGGGERPSGPTPVFHKERTVGKQEL